MSGELTAQVMGSRLPIDCPLIVHSLSSQRSTAHHARTHAVNDTETQRHVEPELLRFQVSEESYSGKAPHTSVHSGKEPHTVQGTVANDPAPSAVQWQTTPQRV